MDTFHCREDDRSFLSIVHVVAAQHVANCVAGFDLKSAMRRCVMNVRFSEEVQWDGSFVLSIFGQQHFLLHSIARC